ncbi:TonB-dependent hemoglobin/transferrin/lactoferrin family receptor [Rodentibacter caecimuris]|uniref:Ligand-gated channel protein n=1 Tax=Rodentibacter caecimuris TaxID=1796644 RepID=A0ABX3KZ16_9PAST|nr:ligand-gated channel protein [Rodentibacter heylii]
MFKKHPKTLKYTPIVLILTAYSNSVLSEKIAENSTALPMELETINVNTELTTQNEVHKTPAIIKKNVKTIQDELIRDTADLVRYSTDVGISDNGRRLKGFAMRGVEGNRVGISIDGVSLPDSEENSLYSRYGNFNNSRLSVDPELIRNIEIVRGSDSLSFGSGSLGGNVNYHTLEAIDIVKAGNTFGGFLRSGYTSKNQQWINSLGFGYIGENIDAILIYSQRRGHETQSAGGDIVLQSNGKYDTPRDVARRAEIGAARIHPDPSNHINHSFLAKLGWNFIPGHRLGISLNGQKNSNYTDEKSYSLMTYWREADDRQKRLNLNVFYEWAPQSNLISLVRTDFDYQKTENGAVNYKGSFERVGGNYNDGFIYQKSYLQHRDNRNLKTDFYRVSLSLDSQPLTFWNTEHQLKFKTSLSRREFKNINQDDILNPDGSLNMREIYTIQYPIKAEQYMVSLQDHLIFNDIFSARVGVGYHYEKVKPQHIDPNIPCGKSSGFGRLCSEVDMNGKVFNNWSGLTALEAQLNDTWKLGYQFSTGYRVPTASEMFFTFESPYGNWAANPDLTSEKSQNHHIFLQGKGKYGELDINLYETRYRHFLFEQETLITRTNPNCDWYAKYYTGCTDKQEDYYQQMVNLDSAKIKGIEFKGNLDLHQLFSALPNGLKLQGALGYSKGKLSTSDSLLSIQPLKFILGLDYEDPNGVWGIFSRLTYLGGKKPKDAQVSEMAERCVESGFDYWSGSQVCKKTESYLKTETYRWLNNKAFVFDLFGYYKPTSNMTLRAGIYNLFNRKYHTWDSLRGLNRRSTVNTVDWDKGQGLERFYAPGRNYSASVEIRF